MRVIFNYWIFTGLVFTAIAGMSIFLVTFMARLPAENLPWHVFPRLGVILWLTAMPASMAFYFRGKNDVES